MRLHVYCPGTQGAREMREHVERRLAFALGRFGDEIDTVHVRLRDMNGPRGGVDKQVSLRVRGRRLPSMFVTESHESLLAAIDRGADRLGHAIGRALERDRDESRGIRRAS